MTIHILTLSSNSIDNSLLRRAGGSGRKLSMLCIHIIIILRRLLMLLLIVLCIVSRELGTIQRSLALPLRKDDTHKSRCKHLFQSGYSSRGGWACRLQVSVEDIHTHTYTYQLIQYVILHQIILVSYSCSGYDILCVCVIIISMIYIYIYIYIYEYIYIYIYTHRERCIYSCTHIYKYVYMYIYIYIYIHIHTYICNIVPSQVSTEDIVGEVWRATNSVVESPGARLNIA